MREETRQQIEAKIRELRAERRERGTEGSVVGYDLSISPDDLRARVRLSRQIDELRRLRGAKTAREAMLRMDMGNRMFGYGGTTRCGHCGGTLVSKSHSRHTDFEVHCTSCGFEDKCKNDL